MNWNVDSQLTSAMSLRYSFGEFDLDVQSRRLIRGARDIKVEPKVFDLLVLLLQQHPCVVSRSELNRLLWPGTAVCSGALHQCVATLRRTLGDEGRAGYIRTHHRVGYQFTAFVRSDEVLPNGILNNRLSLEHRSD
jgi:DNA-binding winged helix-turn-helix (wHTH) protein